MEPKFVSLPAFTVVGMQLRAKPHDQNIPKLWGEFAPRMGEIPHPAEAQVSYGVSGSMDERTGEFDYVAACKVKRVDALPAGMVRVDIPAQAYAVFPTTLPKIADSFQAIHGTWLPHSGYRQAPGPLFERYDEKWEPDDPNSEFYLYIPVTKAT